jgi:hypothetical protein
MAPEGWKRVLATVGCPALQFNPIEQPFIAFDILPFAITHNDGLAAKVTVMPRKPISLHH